VLSGMPGRLILVFCFVFLDDFLDIVRQKFELRSDLLLLPSYSETLRELLSE